MTVSRVTLRDALAPLIAERLGRCTDGVLQRVAEEIASEMLRASDYDERWRKTECDCRLHDLADEIERLALGRAAFACDYDTLLIDEPIGPWRR